MRFLKLDNFGAFQPCLCPIDPLLNNIETKFEVAGLHKKIL